MKRKEPTPAATANGPRKARATTPKQARQRAPLPTFAKTWAGNLHLRDQYRALAIRGLEAEGPAVAAAEARGWSVTAAFSLASIDPSFTECPEVARFGQVLRELEAFQFELIWTHHIDGNFLNAEFERLSASYY